MMPLFFKKKKPSEDSKKKLEYQLCRVIKFPPRIDMKNNFKVFFLNFLKTYNYFCYLFMQPVLLDTSRICQFFMFILNLI